MAALASAVAWRVPSFKRCTRGSSDPGPFPLTWSRLAPRYPPSSEAVPAHAAWWEVHPLCDRVPQSQFVDRCRTSVPLPRDAGVRASEAPYHSMDVFTPSCHT
ncbi:hypothetical protein B0H13DRAFT_2318250 [Mycena leptocephala]|nr:hypothetical protein B0H13DRAFT_2318250 [Mycena leptocephala]